MQFIFNLRDANLPKLVCEDVPLFLGLTSDLFPCLDCPRVGYSNFEAAVETALVEEGYVVLPAQVSCKKSYLTGSYDHERMRSTFHRTWYSHKCR
jgi:hypothetical protein